ARMNTDKKEEKEDGTLNIQPTPRVVLLQSDHQPRYSFRNEATVRGKPVGVQVMLIQLIPQYSSCPVFLHLLYPRNLRADGFTFRRIEESAHRSPRWTQMEFKKVIAATHH